MEDLKKWLDTPGKVRAAALCALVAAITLGILIGYAVHALGTAPEGEAPPEESEAVSLLPEESPTPAPTEEPAQSQGLVGLVPALTIDEARELALADAGVAPEEAEISREALAEDNGLMVYEFRFRTRDAQYEYKLNANSGEVRAKVKEVLAADTPAPAESAAPRQSNPPEATQAPAAPTPTPAPIQTPAPTQTPQPTGVYIGMDRAKSAALNHAGLSAAQVTFTHAAMDREDGVMVYEIEFHQGRTEYEYTIDAATGRILEHEIDAD